MTEVCSAIIGDGPAARVGARNLLLDCVGVRAGDEVLVVRESSALGQYESAPGEIVADEAVRLGARVTSIWPPPIDRPEDLSAILVAAMEGADHTLFFSQIGDQIRFDAVPGAGSKTMCYALDADYLGAPFCTLRFGALQAVQNQFVAELARASTWRMTCANGTDATGRIDGQFFQAPARGRFTLGLFPTMIFDPLPCQGTNGQVAITHWLMTTSTYKYDNDIIRLDEPVLVDIEDDQIAAFRCGDALAAKLDQHYRQVAGALGSDEPFKVHSWHTGINPTTFYPQPPDDNFDRWGRVSFGSPRYTHFHTCGANPGLIASSLFDATITLDGQPYWEEGQFVFLQREDIKTLLAEHGVADGVIDSRRDIGI